MIIKVNDPKRDADRRKYVLAAALAADARRKPAITLSPITMWLRALQERDNGQA